MKSFGAGNGHSDSVVVRVSNLRKRFPAAHGSAAVDAVQGVSFELARGETLALVGESGSGKTTVGRCLVGLETPSSGDVTIAANSSRDDPLGWLSMRPQIVFQDPLASLDPRMRVGKSIEEPLHVLGRRERLLAKERITHALELAHFPSALLGRYPHELSAGQQQRACIARALVTAPQVIVLDEPTSMLDASLRAGLIEMLRRLQEQLNIAYLFITHDLNAVKRIAGHVLVMYRGRIVESASRSELFRAPMHPYTEALLNAVFEPVRPASLSVRSESPPGNILSGVKQPYGIGASLPGCAFAARCPIAEAACWEHAPSLDETGANHRVACFVRQREARAIPVTQAEMRANQDTAKGAA
jgi:oligopeptide/dipeptide ABC transporter ATP-binding protein